MDFGEPVILQTDYDKDGRFGMSLSKIGDINRDGFNGNLFGFPLNSAI